MDVTVLCLSGLRASAERVCLEQISANEASPDLMWYGGSQFHAIRP